MLNSRQSATEVFPSGKLRRPVSNAKATMLPTWGCSVPCAKAMFLLLVILSFIPLAQCQCTRQASDTTSSAKFLCSLNVTFERQSDCSALVSETIVFPHTTGETEDREIKALPGVQQVSDITLSRNDEPLSIRPKLVDDSTVMVTLPTERSTKPTTFVLSYEISNAAMQFTDGCGKGEPNPSNNVLRWRAGPITQTVDTLSMRFSTTADRSLSAIGDGGIGGRVIRFVETDFEKELDFSVEEAGGQLCPLEQTCFSRFVPIWQTTLIIVLIAVPVALAGTCMVVFVVCDLCGLRPDVHGDDAVDESEKVGFRNGRYSHCIPNNGSGGCECKQEREFLDIE